MCVCWGGGRRSAPLKPQAGPCAGGCKVLAPLLAARSDLPAFASARARPSASGHTHLAGWRRRQRQTPGTRHTCAARRRHRGRPCVGGRKGAASEGLGREEVLGGCASRRWPAAAAAARAARSRGVPEAAAAPPSGKRWRDGLWPWSPWGCWEPGGSASCPPCPGAAAARAAAPAPAPTPARPPLTACCTAAAWLWAISPCRPRLEHA